MFLLNPNPSVGTLSNSSLFTSHYVPIKSLKNNLLNVQISLFTSHYVPIKSSLASCAISSSTLFTSHYVPIKSCIQQIPE